MGLIALLKDFWGRLQARALAAHLDRRMQILDPEQYLILARMFGELHEDMEKQKLAKEEVERRLEAINLKLRQFETGRVNP